MIVVDYEIRSDVDQEFQGQKLLFDNFVVTEKINVEITSDF